MTVRTLSAGNMQGLTAAQILSAASQVSGKHVIIVTTVSALQGTASARLSLAAHFILQYMVEHIDVRTKIRKTSMRSIRPQSVCVGGPTRQLVVDKLTM